MASTSPTEQGRLHRPIPTRLASLQPFHVASNFDQTPLGPLKSTPQGYQYPSEPSSSMPRPVRPPKLARPGGPTRSHSFCGDTSASTYALASAKAGTHLSRDKRELVAPPLERTLSSIGIPGNRRSTSYQISRPAARQRSPLTPPASPPRTSMAVPQILVSSPPRSRPGLNPLQRSTSPDLSARAYSDASSRAPSYVLATPTDSSTMVPLVPSVDANGKARADGLADIDMA